MLKKSKPTVSCCRMWRRFGTERGRKRGEVLREKWEQNSTENQYTKSDNILTSVRVTGILSERRKHRPSCWCARCILVCADNFKLSSNSPLKAPSPWTNRRCCRQTYHRSRIWPLICLSCRQHWSSELASLFSLLTSLSTVWSAVFKIIRL